ncbi:MAG: serine/threonine-protein kinase, partial [Myxococcota bacterium]|nr:serine/threonine-protein kinase [Myxococcota bacterium]
MAEPKPDKDPLVGQVVDGRYRIVARLSEGGMGVVYRAEHVFLKRDVALKRLHPELTGHGEVVARFEREAQAAARIDHPNVCSVLDCGVGEDGALYVAMELLEGASLEARIVEAAPLPLPEIVDVAVQICDALGRAHDLGVVHRDLKPENVMLVPRREGGMTAKIMDFGIAKVVAQSGASAKSTATVGTPLYMAPEQVQGRSDLIDGRTDIWAMGVVLYEMLTGQLPFPGMNYNQVILKITSGTY